MLIQHRRLDDTTFGAGTFSWQDPVHYWKAGPGEVMTVETLSLVRSRVQQFLGSGRNPLPKTILDWSKLI